MQRFARRARWTRAGWLLPLVLTCAACSGIPSPEQRRQLADDLAAQKGWHAHPVHAGAFDLLAVHSPQPASTEKLTVYIEGDGFAWVTPSQPSSDPTPRDPVALRLALAQPEGYAAYLARPCQYIEANASHCDRRYWTEARFAEKVIDANDKALDVLKQRFGARRLTLVGYSGGGAIALLVAARRDDVAAVVTVAGNLDHRAWTALHGLQPLAGSLDPLDYLDALQAIPQWHFAGANDGNITPALVRGFAQRFAPPRRPRVRIEPAFDHRCCWADSWPALWRSMEPRHPDPRDFIPRPKPAGI